MNYLPVLTNLKKEIWEFNKTLFWVPVVIAVIMLVAPILQMFLLSDYQVDRIFEVLPKLEQIDDTAKLEKVFMAGITGVFMPFIMSSLFIQLYYFTSCLFDERRDLSVYFWRSLPVSDHSVIAVKLLTGALVIPAVFMLAATAVVLVMLVIILCASAVFAIGYDISLWGVILYADIFTTIASIWLNLLPYALWMFPVFAWLMLASMYATKAPFLWAVLPVVVVLFVEAFLVEYFNLGSPFVLSLLGDYFAFTEQMLPRDITKVESPKLVIFSLLWQKISIIATLFGAGLVYLTYWLRVNRG